MSESAEERERILARNREYQRIYREKHPGRHSAISANSRQKKEDEEFVDICTKTFNSLEQMIRNIICIINSLDINDPNYDNELHNLMGKIVGIAGWIEIRDGKDSLNNPIIKWLNELPKCLQLDQIAYTVKPTRFDNPNFKFKSADYSSPETHILTTDKGSSNDEDTVK